MRDSTNITQLGTAKNVFWISFCLPATYPTLTITNLNSITPTSPIQPYTHLKTYGKALCWGWWGGFVWWKIRGIKSGGELTIVCSFWVLTKQRGVLNLWEISFCKFENMWVDLENAYALNYAEKLQTLQKVFKHKTITSLQNKSHTTIVFTFEPKTSIDFKLN